MKLGVPKEVKDGEHRVGLVPASVRELVVLGHPVWVEHNAGIDIGFTDEDYHAVGGQIVDHASVYRQAEFIIKVKEPQPSEYKYLQDKILFTYLHLAADKKLTQALMDSGCIALGYETVTDDLGRLPLLSPMSEIAGCLAVQVGAHYLEKNQQGRGILLGGVAGVEKGNVLVLGGGNVGMHAIRIALGHGAKVTVLDNSVPVLKRLDLLFTMKLNTIFASRGTVEASLKKADLVIGAVLSPGHATPILVTAEMVKEMKPGAVIVDVSVDQGGCFETSRPTGFDKPTYLVNDVVHYCVTNMPGAVPRTASLSLNNATVPFIIEIANKGYHQALSDDINLMHGLNVAHGQVTHQAVAQDLGFDYVAAADALGGLKK